MTPAQQGPCDRGPQELAQRSGPATSRVVGSRFLAYFWVKWGAELKGAISDQAQHVGTLAPIQERDSLLIKI